MLIVMLASVTIFSARPSTTAAAGGPRIILLTAAGTPALQALSDRYPTMRADLSADEASVSAALRSAVAVTADLSNIDSAALRQSRWFQLAQEHDVPIVLAHATPDTLDATFKQPCYSVTVAPGQAVWARFGNSTAPLLRIASVQTFSDVAICDLAPTDDAGNVVAPERDLWEEEEAASGTTLFLPLLAR